MPKSPGRAAFAPVVYGGIVLLMLILGVLAHGFTRNIGDARLVGRYATLPLFQSRVVSDLTISWNGLALRFSSATTPSLQSVESTTDGGTDLVFDGDVRLHLAPGRDTNGSVSLTTVPGSARGETLLVPYTVAGVPLEPTSEAALTWTRAGHIYLLSLPASARVDASARTLSLPLDGSTWTAGLKMAGTTAVIAAAPVARPAVSTARIPDEKDMPTAEQVTARMTQFLDNSYAGWSQARIASSGTWKMPDGTTGFSEDIGVALLAESIARGTWQGNFPVWNSALAAQQAINPNLSLMTSAYSGGVRDYVRLLQTRTAAQVETLRPLIAASDVKALATPGLIGLVTDHGDADLLQASIAFITSRSPTSLDVPSAVWLLEALVDDQTILGGNVTVAKAMKDVVEKRILPALRATDAGVFLESSNALVDVKTSIHAGALLLVAGDALSDTRLSAYGRGLLTSGLSLGDEAGILPVTLSIASGKISKRDGALGPESIYPLLPLDRRVAREVPLTRQLGQGAWIWTAARIVTAEFTATQATLVLAYPAGIAHNVVIQGIRPFSMVKLHGIPWHTDPTYSKYSDGWSYDATTRTFYLKVTGRSEQEEIDIVY
jgi:hypothetical protein